MLKELSEQVKNSGLFDERFYTSMYPDVVSDPLLHYLIHGEKEGRLPNPLFDPNLVKSELRLSSDASVLDTFIRCNFDGNVASIPSPFRKDDGLRFDLAGIQSAYINGLYGTGRWYFNSLVLANNPIATLFRDGPRALNSQVPCISSGHCLFVHAKSDQFVSDDQAAVFRLILDTPLSCIPGKLISSIRHPFDSILTTWVWLAHYLQDGRMIEGISQSAFASVEDLVQFVELHFNDFQIFLEGAPIKDCFSWLALEGHPYAQKTFLSFRQLLDEMIFGLSLCREETLRFEEFVSDHKTATQRFINILCPGYESRFGSIQSFAPKTSAYKFRTLSKKSRRLDELFKSMLSSYSRYFNAIGYGD